MAATQNGFAELGRIMEQNGQDADAQDDVDLGKVITEAIGNILKPAASPKQASASNTASTRNASKSANKAAADINGGKIGEIDNSVILAIQPMISKSITSAVTASTKVMMDDMRRDMDKREANRKQYEHTSLHNVKRAVNTHNFEIDRLEQYSRKENIKVFGTGIRYPRERGRRQECSNRKACKCHRRTDQAR
jgi:hypothetical protein